MKILQVVNAYYPPYSAGGVAFGVHNISKALAKRGHEVTVYTTNILSKDKLFRPKKNPNYNNWVKVYYFSNELHKPSIHIYFSKKLVKAIKKTIANNDLVHLHEYRSYISLVTSYYAKRHGIPYILQAHGQLSRIGAWRRLKWLYDVLFGYRLLRDAARVIALNRREADQYRRMGVPEEKIAIIPNGIDLSEYAELPPKGSFKKKFSIPEDRKIILYIGRIHKIKGIDFLVRAYAYLKNEMRCKDAVLVIVGSDDGFLGEVKSLVQSLGISRFVIFTGPLYGEEKLGAYVDSDIVVLPSRYETFPNVVLEAYACSKLVVASNVEAIPDIVLHGKTGLLFQAGDVKGLANAIAYMLTHSEEAERMGRNARRLVEERFSIDRVVTQLEALYEKVLKDELGNA
jgi:glycosyltransferase involved in cell wall biosynthesis